MVYVTGFGKTLRKGSARDSRNARLVAKVKICQSPDFVIYMSNNPSSNLPSSTEASRAI